MPVRLLNSSVLKWPDRATVRQALEEWTHQHITANPAVVRAGVYGSFARGDWGVGSDIDLIVIVKSCDTPFDRRSASWDTSGLPVQADVVVYTEEEWHGPLSPRFLAAIERECLWFFHR